MSVCGLSRGCSGKERPPYPSHMTRNGNTQRKRRSHHVRRGWLVEPLVFKLEMARYLVNGSRRGEKTALPVMKTLRLDP